MTKIADRTPTDPLDEVPGQGNQRLHGLGYNLRAVYRAAWTGGGATTATGHRRVVRVLDSAPRDVGMVPPLSVIGFADGVQNQFLLRHEAHRPISLVWAAAGAVDGGATLLEFGQRLELVGSAADEALLTKLSDLGGGMPFHLLPDLTPWGVATATQHLVDGRRRELERAVSANVPIPEGKHLIVDGSIRQHTRDELVGVVKSVDTMYVGDESVIPNGPAGAARCSVCRRPVPRSGTLSPPTSGCTTPPGRRPGRMA